MAKKKRTPQQVGRHSSKKGGGYERLMSKRLSLWISNGERDDLLWRSAMSGGRATLKAKKGGGSKSQSGDLSAIDPLGCKFLDLFVVSLRHRKDFKFHRLVTQNKGLFVESWQDVCNEAHREGKHPMLIVRQNRCPDVIAVDNDGIDTIEEGLKGVGIVHEEHGDVLLSDFFGRWYLARISLSDSDMFIYGLEGFLSMVPMAGMWPQEKKKQKRERM